MSKSSQIDTLYLTHKDRLLRFGNELIIMIAKQFNTKVVILHQQEEGFETKLAKDVLEIITVFSARLYGSRSHKNKTNKSKQSNHIDSPRRMCPQLKGSPQHSD